MRRPTLKTLARQLDLSVTTISRALKDGPEVRPETIARVKAAAAALAYRPDPRAVGLRTGRTGVVAVLFWEPHVDDVGDSSVAPIVEGVCRRLEGTSYTAMIQLLLPGMEGLDRVSRIVEGKLADGLILSGTTPQDERVRYMLERRFPSVTFGRTELFTPHPWYDIDNELAAWQATSHLAQEGRRRIALIDPPRHLTFAQHRLLGYRRALAEAGLRFDPALVVQGGLGAAESRAAPGALRACATPRPASSAPPAPSPWACWRACAMPASSPGGTWRSSAAMAPGSPTISTRRCRPASSRSPRPAGSSATFS